jgi:hypothetical protein
VGEGEDRKYIGQGKGPEEDLVRKRRLFAPFCSKNASFYQDRLGTNIGKVEKWVAFSYRNRSPSTASRRSANYVAYIVSIIFF